jgi:isopentenyl-diphosphate Delta-isomerase
VNVPTEVILVNENDEPIGTIEKLEAHKKCLLHRAFSVFILNTQHEMLLQQRANSKYHSGGLWSNACCSHPQPLENTKEAAEKRLKEEMGFNVPLEKIFHFIYKAQLTDELAEYEFDHVFIGLYDGEVKPNIEEVQNYCFKKLSDIKQDLVLHPLQFTAWFPIAFYKLEQWLANNTL